MSAVEAESMEVDDQNVGDPFSQTRLGNESNPFVNGVVYVSDPLENDDEQEFTDR